MNRIINVIAFVLYVAIGSLSALVAIAVAFSIVGFLVGVRR